MWYREPSPIPIYLVKNPNAIIIIIDDDRVFEFKLNFHFYGRTGIKIVWPGKINLGFSKSLILFNSSQVRPYF